MLALSPTPPGYARKPLPRAYLRGFGRVGEWFIESSASRVFLVWGYPHLLPIYYDLT